MGHRDFVHVRDGDPGSFLDQVPHQRVADLADTADDDVAVAEVGVAPQDLGHRLHGVVDAVGRRRRRVARPAQGS